MAGTKSKTRQRLGVLKMKRNFIIITVLILFLAAFLAYGYLIPQSQVFGKVYYKASPQKKVVALTFDDGPSEPYTSEILDVLKKRNVTATFFIIGSNAEIYQNTLKRIVAEGHVIGDHTYSHLEPHAITTQGCHDAVRAQAAIYNITGLKTKLYRPPFGRKTPWEINCIKKHGMNEIMWTTPRLLIGHQTEFGTDSSDAIANTIINKAKPGDILLLHDSFGTCHDTALCSKEKVVRATEKVVTSLQEQGYTFVTIPELLSIPAYG